jgi:hypothetical protein
MGTSNNRLNMFSRRLPLAVGLFGFVILVVVIWVSRTSKNKVVNSGANIVSNQRVDNSRSDQTRSRNKGEQRKISDAEKIELAHNTVTNIQFPTKGAEAEIKLKEELEFLYSLPSSHDRYFLLSFLIKAYSQATFEASPSKEEFLDRMQRFGAIIKKSAAGADVERLLISASEQCAKMIGALPSQKGEILRNYLEIQGTIGDEQMGARIAASCYVETLKSSEVPDGSLFDSIGDSNVRKLAEKMFLRTFDFGQATEKVVETFAIRYLDPNSNVNPDHEIAIRLFGIGLQRYPEAISTVILATPPSQKKDAAIEQMIFRIAPDDIERARLWWDHIQDPNIKKRAELDILGKRQRGTPKPMPVMDPSNDPFQ